MRKLIMILASVVSVSVVFPAWPQAGPAIGYHADGDRSFTPHPAAAVEIRSSGKGVLLPRLGRAERLAMEVDPSAAGLVVYQHDGDKGLYVWDGAAWVCYNPSVSLPDSGQQTRFALVAVTGDYGDLEGRPDIPEVDGELARVAYTGRYEDLEGLPDIPEALRGLHVLTLTGDYGDLEGRPLVPSRLGDLEQDEFAQLVSDADIFRWDSSARRAIPARLRELEADSLHRTVTQGQKSVWDEAASRSVPSRVSDMEEDAYYMAVALEEWEAWDAHASVPVPSRLSDLEQDYEAQLVSDADIRRWDAAVAIGTFSGDYEDLRNKPFIPSRLSDLEPDSLHRTVSDAQMDAWTGHAELEAKLSVADYAGSVHNASGYYALVSEKQKALWNEAFQTLSDTLSAPAQANDFLLLADRPAYALVAYTGRYEDLEGKPDFQLAFVASNSLSDLSGVPGSWPKFWLSCSLNDLPGKPDFHPLALEGSCAWEQVEGRPRFLSDLEESAAAVKVPRSRKEAYGDIHDFYRGEGDYAEGTNRGILRGSFADNSLYLAPSLLFPGRPSLPSSGIPDTSGNGAMRVASIGAVKALDKAALAGSGGGGYPEGTILMSDRYPTEALAAGWCLFREMENRFPVAANVGLGSEVERDAGLSAYADGATGGAAEVALTEAQIPPHVHRLKTKKSGMAGTSTPFYVVDDASSTASPRYMRHILETVGGGQAHENRPPYRAVYFIIKSKKYCRTGNQ